VVVRRPREEERSVRRKILVLLAATLVALSGLAACGQAVEHQVRQRVEHEVQQGKQKVEDKVRQGKRWADKEVQQGKQRLREEGQKAKKGIGQELQKAKKQAQKQTGKGQ
jgi:uncharacterized protein YhjY with autotransporter beta-barrel domain